jgi:translation initiation factor IF-2
MRSLASVRRAREKEKQRAQQMRSEGQKVIRDVIVPEAITVQELANRMAERGADVIKALMKMGIMANINQTLDPDTAELVATEFGHRVRRVSAADVEIGLHGDIDETGLLQSRPPVVTVMGHVDHGKTSLLDALRQTDVAGREAGGITQHIGAYQVTRPSGQKITFIDTPGHAAFTEMRARGANVTDIVVLVVAADDGVMPQTIEAIHHARAAKVPIVVAVNKIDRPDANPERVRRELLQQGLVVEGLGGDVLAVDVSAKEKPTSTSSRKRSCCRPNCSSSGPTPIARPTAPSSKRGWSAGAAPSPRCSCGAAPSGSATRSWPAANRAGCARSSTIAATPSSRPAPRCRSRCSACRARRWPATTSSSSKTRRGRARSTSCAGGARDAQAVVGARGTLEEMFSKIAAGETRELPVVVKCDVQGSLEAIVGSLTRLGTDEVSARVLHAAVGGINESDVTLARASNAMVIGFNVRANPQARELARRDNVDIRYYSIIYNVVDDIKAALSGMLSPTVREKFLGYAQIREVFNITKVGKVAGCQVTEGSVQRGAKVRLIRDNVVIHEGKLSTLKRFKDEVKEVQVGQECGMAFEGYQDMRVGDVIECFRVERIERKLA